MDDEPMLEHTAGAGNSFCARRGSQWLDEQDLLAHLVVLVRVENLGALLGSGASAGSLGDSRSRNSGSYDY